MDIAFDFSQGGRNDLPRPLEWHGLRARLLAADAARRVLETPAGGTGSTTFQGSFDRDSARFLAGYGHGLAVVNPTALGNRKPDGDMTVSVAGESRTGDRG